MPVDRGRIRGQAAVFAGRADDDPIDLPPGAVKASADDADLLPVRHPGAVVAESDNLLKIVQGVLHIVRFVVELRPDDLRLDLDGGAVTSVLEGGGAEPKDFG